MNKNAEKLLTALRVGNVINAGGILCTNGGVSLGLTFTDLYEAVHELREQGHRIERVDAGGRPEWELKSQPLSVVPAEGS